MLQKYYPNLLASCHPMRQLTICLAIVGMLTLIAVTAIFAVNALANGSELPKKSIKMDPNTVLVLWGTRHGNRHPENFIMPDGRGYGDEGNLELTKFGKLQAYGLGKELREFVGNKFISLNYLPKEVKYYSSSANRCQMTLQAALAGLHRPVQWGDWETKKYDDWSPIPYTINDPLLRMYAVENCPNSDSAWQPISDDTWEPLRKEMEEKRILLDYIQRSTGQKANLSYAADIADNLIEIDLYGAAYPQWIEQPTLPGYNKTQMIKAILEFAESHQIACTDYAPCRKMMGGYWANHVLESIQKAVLGEGPRVIGYAAHTEVTLATMKLLGYVKDELTTSAGFVIEFRKNPQPSVRLLSHDPNPIEDHVIYKGPLVPQLANVTDADGFVPLTAFQMCVVPNTIVDWEKACGRQPPTCTEPPPKADNRPFFVRR